MDREYPQAWLALGAAFFTLAVASLNTWKISPVIPTFIQEFGLSSYAVTGLLAGVSGIIAVIIVIPSGFIISRYGPRKMAIFALFAIVIGSLTQIFATDFTILFLGRILEGLGSALTLVSTSTLVSMYFPGHRIGIGMGIFSAAFPFGNVLGVNLSSVISSTYGWRVMWSLGIALTFPVMIMLLILKNRKTVSKDKTIKTWFSSTQVWLIPTAQFAMVSAGIALVAWCPTYLNEVRMIPITYASFIPSITTMMAIIVGPLGGWLLDKFNIRKSIYLIPLAALAFLYPTIPYVGTQYLVLMMIVVGVFNNLISPWCLPKVVRASGPNPEIGMAVFYLYAQLGTMVGPTLFGAIYDVSHSWENSFLSLLIPIAMGLVVNIVGLKIIKERK
jgi:predicted MFS family arabinose efflux permease